MSTPDPYRELAEEIAGLMLPPEWEDGEMTPEEAREHLRGQISARLRSALPTLSSLLGELGVKTEALERIANPDVPVMDDDGEVMAHQRLAGTAMTAIARSALSSDAGRLAGEVLRQVLVIYNQDCERVNPDDINVLHQLTAQLLAAHPELKKEAQDA